MNLLLTNDDGINGEGLTVLALALIKAGHSVTVVAPDCNNSAVSHKINMRSPLRLSDHSKQFGYPAYALNGTPADCVMFALGALKIKPQAVLSGINDGMNLGSDCMYSGTVGGAQEGAQNGIPSIAISANYHCDCNLFEKAARIVTENLEEWVLLAKETKGALNVNIPAKQTIRGIRFCKTVKHNYNSRYVQNEDGSFSFDLSNSLLESEACDDGDYPLFRKGYVTVTPLLLDKTDYDLLERWKQ